MDEVAAKVNKVLSNIFADELKKHDLILDYQAEMGGTSFWDSIRHIRIIIEIEKEFQIKIGTAHISKLTSVQKIIEYLYKQKAS